MAFPPVGDSPEDADALARELASSAAARVGPRALALACAPPLHSPSHGGASPTPPAAPPLVHAVAAAAFAAVLAERPSQAIILTGQQGSGKSQCAKILMQILCSVSFSAAKKSRVISGAIKMESLLEAFGHAAAPHSQNASRFGRFTECQYDARGKLIGIKLFDYLLDRDRVSDPPALERNFNVFYYLLVGASEAERVDWRLPDSATFRYLCRVSNVAHGPSAVVMRERFAELRLHMKSLGIGTRTQSLIFSVVAAILHIGEIEFIQDTSSLAAVSSSQPCSVKNRDSLDHVANLLGVTPADLERSLTVETRIAGRELCTAILSHSAAERQRDTLAKTLYSLVFRWIVEHINSRLCQDTCDGCIGILDFVAFQGATENNNGIRYGFETLLVNAANERMAAYTFRRYGTHLYTLCTEGIVEPQANLLHSRQTAVDLLWSPEPNGALTTITECSKTPTSDMRTLEARASQKLITMCSSSPFFTVDSSDPRSNANRGASDSRMFAIQHYAGQVQYSAESLVERNRRAISPDIVALFRGSTDMGVSPASNMFVRHLFSEKNVKTSMHARNQGVISSAYQSGVPQRHTSFLGRVRPQVDAADPGSESIADATSPTKLGRDKPQRPKTQLLDIPLQTTDLDVAFTELESTLDTADIWNIFCVSTNNALGRVDLTHISKQLIAMDIPRLISITKTVGNLVNVYMHSEFAARYRQQIIDFSNIPDAGSYTENMMCDAFVSALAMRGERGVRLGPSKVFLSDEVWEWIESMRKASEDVAKSGSVQQVPQPDRVDALGPIGNHGQPGINATATVPFDVAHVPGPPGRRPPSPTCTVDPSNVDEVNFEEDMFADRGSSTWTGDVDKSNLPNNQLTSVDSMGDKEDTDIPIPPKKRMSRQRCQWLCCTWLLTWWIPSIVLTCCCKLRQRDVRIAWREKVALCTIIFLMCCSLLFFIVGLGRIICPKQDVYSPPEISSMTSSSQQWVYAYGRVYQINEIVSNHFSSYGIPNFSFAGFLGNDVSPLFYPAALFSKYCPGLPTPQRGWDNLVGRPLASANNYAHRAIDPTTGTQKLYLEFMNRYARARVGFTLEYISKVASAQKRLIVIHDNVYDVSAYFNSQTRFFGPVVEQLFGNFYGRDATAQWAQIVRSDPTNAPVYLECMNNLFYIGTVDHRNDFKCQFSNYILLASSIFVVAVIGVKFLAALQFGSSREPEYHDKFVICQVPCYTEGSESLGKTLESLATMKYDDRCKLLFVICDGMVIGSGNDRSTPEMVLELLGIDPSLDPEPMSFQSLGEGDMQLNMAKVYSGLYEVQGHSVPFIVVVKVGKPTERIKPGNRGKRDSQLILMRFLNRVHFNAEMSPLELEIYHHISNVIGINPSYYEYILMVDADTEVMPDALNRLVSTLAHDSKIMGLCGETLLSNEKDSWITMIQVYEYFISHHLAKAFESLFGTVTCLPGCFCVYRVRSPKNVPLLIATGVLSDYSQNNVNTLHLKNLLQLGEDRYLTTLMLKHFPSMRTKFTPEAICRTNAPDTWRILLSQRRRWINSTVHNLFELVFLEQLCGFCCFSMRFVVLLDLFSTLVQPASVLYIGYLIYSLVTSPDSIPVISIVMLAAIYGFQTIIFILKRQWAQIGWMIVYLLAMPVFSLYIPLYAFWRFDDFSWGNTRMVAGANARGGGSGAHGGKKAVVKEFDPALIPLKRWTASDRVGWESQSQASRTSYGSHGSGGSTPGGATGTAGVHGSARMRMVGLRPAASQRTNTPQQQHTPSPYQAKKKHTLEPLILPHPPPSLASSVPGTAYTDTHSLSPVSPTSSGQARLWAQPGAPTAPHPSATAAAAAVLSRGNVRHMTSDTPVGIPLEPTSSTVSSKSISPLQPTTSSSAPFTNMSQSGAATTPSQHQVTIPDSVIISELRSVLSTVDLQTMTKRQVRETLSSRLGIDLSSRRDDINQWTNDILSKRI